MKVDDVNALHDFPALFQRVMNLEPLEPLWIYAGKMFDTAGESLDTAG